MLKFQFHSKKGVVHLPYNQNSFRITFNVLDYTQSPQVEFLIC